MKKIKIITGIACLIICTHAANAQEFRTNESIASQIKNGTVPGTKISSEAPAKKVTNDDEDPKKISVPVKQQLLNGTYPGIVVAKSASVSSATKPENKKPELASDSKPAPAQEIKIPVIKIPSQEDKTVIENK